MKVDLVKDKLKYLGNFPKINSGNYIGIMKIKKKYIDLLIKAMKNIKNNSNNLYFTESINYIISNRLAKINHLDVNKKFWIEIDDNKDLALAKKKFK